MTHPIDMSYTKELELADLEAARTKIPVRTKSISFLFMDLTLIVYDKQYNFPPKNAISPKS
jgi:hypothetical protein